MAAGSSGWLELLSTDTLTAVIAVIGIVLRMFCSAPTKKHVGEIMLGFAVLMFGMKAMSSSVYDLRSSETFINMLTTFSNPILGIALGIVFTSVIQSASAAVGILQALAITVPYALISRCPSSWALRSVPPFLFCSRLSARVPTENVPRFPT